MTTNEILRIRIGSIVLGEEYIYNEDTDTEEYRYHPARICGVDETSSIYIDGRECMYNIEWIDDYDGENCEALRPMPITQEFLEMNGFANKTPLVTRTTLTNEYGNHHSIVYVLPNNRLHIWHDNHKILNIKCSAVHELQDTLCVCGMSELAFKLKVISTISERNTTC